MSGGGSAGAPDARRGGREGIKTSLPDLLAGSRVVLGPLFAVVFPTSPRVAFLVAGLAAFTDFVDGRLARRLGVGSPRGAVLDVVGDAVFVLSGLSALAWAGVLSVALPIAAAISLLALARSWRRRMRPPGPELRPRGLPDWTGHVAGVLNYGAVFVGAGFVAFEVPISLLRASEVVALVNLAPIALRWLRSARAA